MRLHWVRHGQMEIRAGRAETLAKINRLFNQEEQGGLSARGQREAAAVARHFARAPVDAVYSSPMIRAHETAVPTGEALGREVVTLGGIGELRTGHLPEGSWAQAWLRGVTAAPLLPPAAKRVLLGATLIPLYFESWRRGRTVGGESRADFEGRLQATLSALRSSHPPDATVALFAHGYLIFYLTSRLSVPRGGRLRAYARPYIPNGSITTMELGPSGPPRVVRYAATEHLGTSHG